MAASVIMQSDDLSSYPTVFDPKTLVRKGLCPVTTIARKEKERAEGPSPTDVLPQSHSLYFEVHGDGLQKIVLINGLNTSSFGWKTVVQHFTHVKEDDGSLRYSVLVFDNRGVGNSSTPSGPYNTSGMANDVDILLNYIGWTSPRQLHVVGISMGGMIALELASRIHSRIISLSLIVSTAGGYGTSSFAPLRGAIDIIRLSFTKDADAKAAIAVPMLCPQKWLDQPAIEYDRPEVTNREVLTAEFVHRSTITRKQSLVGALSQMVASITHRVTSARLAQISRSIPKVYIMTGDEDNLVKPTNSVWMKDQMPEAEFELWEGTGHGVPNQHPKRFPMTLERIATEGWKLSHPN